MRNLYELSKLGDVFVRELRNEKFKAKYRGIYWRGIVELGEEMSELIIVEECIKIVKGEDVEIFVLF